MRTRSKTTIDRFSFNQGQSLIETIVAIFVLTTGLASGLALAIFVFGSSSDVSEQVVATSLAREGVEGVRRMRDSNWLQGSLSNCNDVGSGQQCYRRWLRDPFEIRGNAGSGREFRLEFNPQINPRYNLVRTNSVSDYRLYQNGSGAINHDATGQELNFFRRLEIIHQEVGGDYSGTSPLVLVRSVVWWHGRNCPRLTYFDVDSGPQTNCRVVSEEFLTNWKNY